MNPPIPFHKFKKYMNAVKRDYEYMDQISNVTRSDFLYENFGGPSHVLDILSDIFHDGENDNIGYFVFELDWGKNYEPGMVLDKDGIIVPLATLEDLYALLVEELKDVNDPA